MEGFAISVGVFDGVHRGHQEILELLRQGAERRGLRSAVVTFDPHPDLVLGKSEPVWLLSTLEERIELLTQLGIERLRVLRFDRELQETPPEAFVRKFLAEDMKCRLLVEGPGFSLGKGRSGTPEVLTELGRSLGFEFRQAEPVMVRGRQISSTWIREAVSGGDVELALELLGRPYSLRGRVVGGSGRGAGLGYPTANLGLPAIKLPPRPGVYAATAWLGGEERPTAVNVGVRPTFFDPPGSGLIVEAHILDFDDDISGEEMELRMLARLRDERRFEGKAELIEQIAKDIEQVRQIVETSPALRQGAAGDMPRGKGS